MPDLIKTISILGSTGSIGQSTLDVVRMHPGRFKVASLAAGENLGVLKAQIEEFAPKYVSVMTKDAAMRLKGMLVGKRVRVGWGLTGAIEAASHEASQLVVSAITGGAGLLPTLFAVSSGKDVALANKESLVMAGELLMKEAKKRRVNILPIDSEHSAIFQSMAGHRKKDIRRIILTASGGPFLKTPKNSLAKVTPKQALNHPKWKMGSKVTIDSATLMNKGLEVIEARWLFGLEHEKISVAIHPQSIVHSMVEYVDGSVMAQLGVPDMRGPIAYALSFPSRVATGAMPLNFNGLKLEFQDPDYKRFPCLSIAYEALRLGSTYPVVLSVADEVAVEAFLKGKLRFVDIPALIERVMQSHDPDNRGTIDGVMEAGRWARDMAIKSVKAFNSGLKRL